MSLSGGGRRDVNEGRREVDGYVRRRHRGQPRRGMPSAETGDKLDALLALSEIEAALRLFAKAELVGFDPLKRRELAKTALAKLGLAGRLIDSVLLRRGRVLP